MYILHYSIYKILYILSLEGAIYAHGFIYESFQHFSDCMMEEVPAGYSFKCNQGIYN